MQGGVIGGVFLLTYLLSVIGAEEFDDLKQVNSLDHSDLTGNITKEERPQHVQEDFKTLKETHDDLKGDVLTDVTKLTSFEERPQLVEKTQNAEINPEDSSSEDLSNRSAAHSSSSNEPVDSKSPENPPRALSINSQTQETSPHVANLPLTADKTLSNNDQIATALGSGVQNKNKYFNEPLVPPGFVASYVPVIHAQEGLGKNTSNSKSNMGTSETEPTQDTNSDHPLVLGMDLYPPLFAAHLAAKPDRMTTSQQSKGEPFSPVFSSQYSAGAVTSSNKPFLKQANLDKDARILGKDLNIFAPDTQDLRSAADERRSNDEIQVRNTDEKQYSETMNSYPYTHATNQSNLNSAASNELRSGAPYFSDSNLVLSSAQAYAAANSQPNIGVLEAYNQGLNPYSYGYPPGFQSGSIASAKALALSPNGGSASAQSSAIVIEDAKSRVILPHEYIFPHKIPGGDNVVQCTRENEFHHFWSKGFNCLVCICLNEYGVLQPVCASCSGCHELAPPKWTPIIPLPQKPNNVNLPTSPGLYPPLEPTHLPEPTIEANTDSTTPPPVREVPATCSPLPTAQPFTNPLHPCQLCVCEEFIDVLGKPQVQIECRDSPDCVVPPDVSPLPPIPDQPVPVPLPLCEKFPPHVLFPHPKDNCKQCKCSVELSIGGVPEQQITCFQDVYCAPKLEPPSELVTPPAPPIPIPVEPFPGPYPEPPVEPTPENYPTPIQPTNAPPIEQPIPWPPVSTPPSPPIPILPQKGPLPGPSPHDSCRPYPPNQPFQHPWDECQTCQCTESVGGRVVNVEISCFTKPSCCIESPQRLVSATAESGNSAGGGGQSTFNGPSTFEPLYATNNREVPESQGYVKADAIAQTSLNSPINQLSGSYQSSNAQTTVTGSNSQSIAQATAEYNSPTSFNPNGNQQSQGFTNSFAQSSSDSAYPSPVSYQSGNDAESDGVSGGQALTAANVEYNSPVTIGPNNVGNLQNQGTNNAQTDNSLSNSYQTPGPYQSGNNGGAYGSGISQALAESNVEYSAPSPFGFNNIRNLQSPGVVNAIAETSSSHLGYQAPKSYQSGNGVGFIKNSGGQALAEVTSERNTPSLFGPKSIRNQLNPGITNTVTESSMSNLYQIPGSDQLDSAYDSGMDGGSHAYAEANAESNMLTPYLPQHQAYGEANSQNHFSYPKYQALRPHQFTATKDNGIGIMSVKPNEAYLEGNNNIYSTTYRPPTLYSSFNPDIFQSQAYAEAAARYKELMNNNPKSSSLFNQQNPRGIQSQASSQANSQYNGLISTQRPINAGLYNGLIYNAKKPSPIFNPYSPTTSQNLALGLTGAKALSHSDLLANAAYYLPGYQAARALGTMSNRNQQSAIAKALAESLLGPSQISQPHPGYAYQDDYYSGYLNGPPVSFFPDNAGHNQVGYRSNLANGGHFKFNGKPALSAMGSQNDFNSEKLGYSKGQFPLQTTLYPPRYPKTLNYDKTQVFVPGQLSNSNANAFAETKLRTKSGEGFQEDSDFD